MVNHVVKSVVLWRRVGISKDMGTNLRLIIPLIAILKAWFTSFHVRNAERIMLEVPLHRLEKGLTITKVVWFDNGRDKWGISGEHLCAHFYEEEHEGIENMIVKIIDKTDINEPTTREGFWAYKLKSFVLNGLNVRGFL